MLWTSNEILAALENEALKHNIKNNFTIDEVVIDSRKAFEKTLFFALKGENNDGHNFIDQVFENGCKALIIHDESLFEKNKNSDKNLILVKNTFLALYKLAQFSRKRCGAKFIGVTGSVGKTGVKEMLKSAFEKQGKTFATSGNLNNHFGVPLTLCNMPSDSQFAIIEMGMNHAKEIEPLSKLTRPDIAIITTIAPAHIGNFKNEEEIALAKAEIFYGLQPQGFAIINGDNKYCDFLTNQALKNNILQENILSFGQDSKNNYCLQSLEIKAFDKVLIFAKTKNHGNISYEISSIHKATIINSLIIVACLDLLISSSQGDIKKSLEIFKNLKATKGRGEIIEKNFDNKKVLIIDDSYNASVASMKAGIEYLADLKKALNKKRAIAILGDMFELGEKSRELHEETLATLNSFNIDFALLAGDEMKNCAKILHKNNYKIYLDSINLSLEIKNFLQDGDIVLVKGSRGMKMEKTIENLN